MARIILYVVQSVSGGDFERANKRALPEHVLEAIKPVFEVLSVESLLQKCLHGGTQNSNESIHSMIWMRCPKSIFAGRTRLEIGVYDAVIVYSEGQQASMPIFKNLG